jgi:hypothetical protein
MSVSIKRPDALTNKSDASAFILFSVKMRQSYGIPVHQLLLT